MRNAALKKASIGSLLGESLYTLGKLQGDPDTGDLVASMQPPHKGLKTAQAGLIEMADERAPTEGGAQAVVALTHREQTAVWLATRTITGNSRQEHPLMTHLFPKGLTGAKEVPIDDLSVENRRLSTAIKDDPEAAPLVPHVRVLADLDKRLDKPIAALEELDLKDSRAQAQATRARNDYLSARDVLFGALTSRFPRQGDYCNSFFKKHHAKPKSAGEEGAGTGAAAGENASTKA